MLMPARASADGSRKVQGPRRNGISSEEQRQLIGCAFGFAMLAAPFIALAYNRLIGLGVLALALGALVYFGSVACSEMQGPQRTRLVAVTVVNAMLLALTLIALVVLAFG